MLQPNLEEVREFLFAVFKNNIILHCIQYRPLESVKLISKLFCSPALNALVDRLSISDFVEFDRNFAPLIRTNYLSVCESLLSHFSECYREITSNKALFVADQRAKFRQELCKEHAKLLNFSISEDGLGFRFLRGYLYEILVNLVSHNNSMMKEILWEEQIDLEESEL